MTELPSRSKQSEQDQEVLQDQWFYEKKGTTHGPFNFRDLRTLAKQNRIGATDLVWTEDVGARHPAGEVVGLLPVKKKPVEEDIGPPVDFENPNPYATPAAAAPTQASGGGLYFPHLRRAKFSVLACLFLSSVACLASAVFLQKSMGVDFRSSLILVGSLLFFAGGALALGYLARAWDMLQVFGASLTGSQAIFPLVLPFFNALWLFTSLHGWAKTWNRYVRKVEGFSTARTVWTPIFFLFPILFLISQTLLLMYFLLREWPVQLDDPRHQTFHLLQLGALVIGLLCWYQISVSINFLARRKS